MYGKTLANPWYMARRLSAFASYCKSILGSVSVVVLIDLARTIDFVSAQTRGKPVFFSLYRPIRNSRYVPVTTVNYMSALKNGLSRNFVMDRVFSQDELNVIQTVVNGSIYRSWKVSHE